MVSLSSLSLLLNTLSTACFEYFPAFFEFTLKIYFFQMHSWNLFRLQDTSGSSFSNWREHPDSILKSVRNFSRNYFPRKRRKLKTALDSKVWKNRESLNASDLLQILNSFRGPAKARKDPKNVNLSDSRMILVFLFEKVKVPVSRKNDLLSLELCKQIFIWNNLISRSLTKKYFYSPLKKTRSINVVRSFFDFLPLFLIALQRQLRTTCRFRR